MMTNNFIYVGQGLYLNINRILAMRQKRLDDGQYIIQFFTEQNTWHSAKMSKDQIEIRIEEILSMQDRGVYDGSERVYHTGDARED